MAAAEGSSTTMIDPPTSSTTTSPPPPAPSTAAGNAAALIVGSWLTTHARGTSAITNDDNDDRAARFGAIEALGDLLAAGAADAGAARAALLEQALWAHEDPMLRVAALWAVGRAPAPDSAVLDAVVHGLLPPPPPPPALEDEEEEQAEAEQKEGEEEQDDEDPIAVFQRLFVQQLQLAAAASGIPVHHHHQQQQQQQPQHNPKGLLLPPRTNAPDRGAGALQAAAVRAMMQGLSDAITETHVRALIHLLTAGRSEAVARLAARAMLGLAPPRLLGHVGALARAARLKDSGGLGKGEEAWMRGMEGGEGRKGWRPNAVAFEALYAHLDSSLLRPLATALLNHFSRQHHPCLVLAPFLAVPGLRAQLTLEEVGGVVARMERGAGLCGAAVANEGEGKGMLDEEDAVLFAMAAARLVLLHSAEAITAHLTTIITLLPLLPLRLPPSAVFALFTDPHNPFQTLPPTAFQPHHLHALLDLYLHTENNPNPPSCTCPPTLQPTLCPARGCQGQETDARARTRALVDHMLLRLPALRMALGATPEAYMRLAGVVHAELLSPPSSSENEEEEEEAKAVDGQVLVTTVLFHAMPGVWLVPATVEATGDPHTLAALARRQQRVLHQRVRAASALRCLRLLLLLPPPIVAWHLPSVLRALHMVASSIPAPRTLQPLFTALHAALATLTPTPRLAAHASKLLEATTSTPSTPSGRRLAALLRRHGLGRLPSPTLLGLATRVADELGRYATTVYTPTQRRPPSTKPAAEGKRRTLRIATGRWAARRRLLHALHQAAALLSSTTTTNPTLIPPIIALLTHQWGLSPEKRDRGLILPALRALASVADAERITASDVEMLLGWATGAPTTTKPKPTADAIPGTEEQGPAEGSVSMSVPCVGSNDEELRIAALRVLGRVEAPQPQHATAALLEMVVGTGEEEEEEEEGDDTTRSTLLLRATAALALPTPTLLSTDLQSLIAACLATPLVNPGAHYAALRLLHRLPPSHTELHAPTLLRKHIYHSTDTDDEEGDISGLAALLLTRQSPPQRNAGVRVVMQHLVKHGGGQGGKGRGKHPLEALALLDRTLVHARAEAFLFRRLLPPASVARQRGFCQALSRPYQAASTEEAAVDAADAACWGRPQNVLVGMWRLGLVTRAHLDIMLEAIADPADKEARLPLRRFLLKLVLALEGTPLFPTEVLGPWAPQMLTAALALRYTPGVEAAVRLLNNSMGIPTPTTITDPMAVRMAHLGALLEEARAAAAVVAGEGGEGSVEGLEARAREREIWGLIEGVLHG